MNGSTVSLNPYSYSEILISEYVILQWFGSHYKINSTADFRLRVAMSINSLLYEFNMTKYTSNVTLGPFLHVSI